MRILLLNQYFPPDTAATARMAALIVEALAGRHRVTVLAGRPSYDPGERHPLYLWRREDRGGVTVVRVGSSALSRLRLSGRLSNYLSYLALAVPGALVLARDADLVLAMTDPPVAGIAGAVVAALSGRPFVYNICDLYPDVAVAGELLPPGPHVAAWERLHRWALRRARRVIVLGDDVQERVVGKGVSSERVVVVRTGAAPPVAGDRMSGVGVAPGAVAPAAASAALTPGDPGVRRRVRGDLAFVVLHAGNLGFAGAWETLVKGFARLDDGGAGLVFVGDGARRHQVQQTAELALHTARAAEGRVRFLPFFPADQAADVLAAADLHVVTVRRGLEGTVVPSKLYGILAAGRPVLAVAPEGSDVARIVQRYACGFVADPDDPDAVAAAVRQAVGAPDLLDAMGRRALVAARDFEQRGQVARFVQVVEEALADADGAQT